MQSGIFRQIHTIEGGFTVSRVKHLTMLIVKLVLFVLVFALTSALNALQTYPTDGISLTKNLDEDDIDIILENGATLDWTVEDGQLVFDITQSGDEYDDVFVMLTFDDVGYDTTFLRSLLGKDAGDYEEYISAMENGPWLGHVNFCLKGDSFFTVNTGRYTFTDAALGEYTHSVVSSEANESEQTESFTVDRDDTSITVALTFGAKDSGALESGRYTLDAELKLGHPEGKKLNIGYLGVLGILLKVSRRALNEYGWGVFSITNWLTLYCVWVILGWFIYLWRDMRAVIGAFLSGSFSDNMVTVKEIYVNGIYSGSYTESNAGANLMMRIICAGVVWFLLTITIPLRMIWYLIRDIIYLFKEDEVLEDFSYTGNLFGSIGIHALLIGIAGVFGVSKLIGVIALVVGITLCLVARSLCKAVEY